MTVGELLAWADSRELSEWMAFDRIKAEETPESWQQTAQLCAVMEGLWSKKPRGYKSFLPQKLRRKGERITPAALRARLAPFRAQPIPAPGRV